MNTIRSSKLTPLALAVTALVMICATPAHAISYIDNLSFRTTGQDVWGGANGWDYTKTFGGNWGTYAGGSDQTASINAISGSQNAVITPATPDMYIPGIPPLVIPGGCLSVFCLPSITIPGTPGFTIPGIPAIHGDTRTGFDVGANSSGNVGLVVSAHVSGGAVNVTVAGQNTLSLPSSFVSGQEFHVGASTTLGSAVMNTTGLNFQANVNGQVVSNNSLYADGCFFLAGCSHSSSNANINLGQFPIVGIDTIKNQPLSVAGVTVPVSSGHDSPVLGGHVLMNAPVGMSGASASGSQISLQSSQKVLSMVADVGGTVAGITGLPLKSTLDIKVAKVQDTLFGMQAGINLNLNESLSFDAGRVNVTLTFDKAVSVMKAVAVGSHVVQDPPSPITIHFPIFSGFGFKDSSFTTTYNPPPRTVIDYQDKAVSTGNSVTFAAGDGIDLEFTGAVGRLTNRSYSLNGSMLSDNMSLGIASPDVKVEAGCFEASVAGSSKGNQCAYQNDFTFADISAPIQASRFALNGFADNSFAVAAVHPTVMRKAYVSAPAFSEMTMAPVPEPETYAMLLAGLGVMGFVARRRSRVSP